MVMTGEMQDQTATAVKATANGGDSRGAKLKRFQIS
jgi:hypothetical protein